MEASPHKNLEDHIAGNGMNSLSHNYLVHKFLRIPQAMKTEMQRQQWRKNGKNSRNYWHDS